MISIRSKGDFKNTEKLLKKSLGRNYISVLEKYGRMGVDALRDATPKDTGLTADSWEYTIEQNGSSLSVVWNNTNLNRGVNIAILIQMGHGTGTGGYVEGVDYINPALAPIFDELADAAWKEVTSL